MFWIGLASAILQTTPYWQDCGGYNHQVNLVVQVFSFVPSSRRHLVDSYSLDARSARPTSKLQLRRPIIKATLPDHNPHKTTAANAPTNATTLPPPILCVGAESAAAGLLLAAPLELSLAEVLSCVVLGPAAASLLMEDGNTTVTELEIPGGTTSDGAADGAGNGPEKLVGTTVSGSCAVMLAGALIDCAIAELKRSAVVVVRTTGFIMLVK